MTPSGIQSSVYRKGLSSLDGLTITAFESNHTQRHLSWKHSYLALGLWCSLNECFQRFLRCRCVYFQAVLRRANRGPKRSLQRKAWFVSTVNYLQLTSLQLCVTFREMKTYHMHIRVMWAVILRFQMSRVSDRSLRREKNIISRIPWGLPTTSINSCSWQTILFATWSTFNHYVDGVNKPIEMLTALEQLTLGWFCFDHPIDNIKWPQSLQELTFRHNFNKPVISVCWSSSL